MTETNLHAVRIIEHFIWYSDVLAELTHFLPKGRFPMDFALYATLSLIVPILVLLGIITAKIISGKGIPNSDYTPFDAITGHTPVEIHEEKQEKEERDDQGDDKDKHLIRQKNKP